MIQTTNQDIYFKIGTKYLLFVTLTVYKTWNLIMYFIAEEPFDMKNDIPM